MRIRFWAAAFVSVAGMVFWFIHASTEKIEPEIRDEPGAESSLAPRPAESSRAPVAERSAANSAPAGTSVTVPHRDVNRGTSGLPDKSPEMPMGESNAETDPIEARAAELFDAALSGDAAQIDTVFAAVSDPEPAIRAAALDAIAQYMGRDVIPRLQQIADASKNEEQKAAIQETIDFMKLPSLSDQSFAQALSSPSSTGVAKRIPQRNSNVPPASDGP